MAPDEYEVIRATFDKTLAYQQQLETKLMELEAENRCLKDAKERRDFRELVARATLGYGNDSDCLRVPSLVPVIPISAMTFDGWSSPQSLADELSLKTTNSRTFRKFDIVRTVPIRDLWAILHTFLLKVFKIVQHDTIKISMERLSFGSVPTIDVRREQSDI